MPSHATTAAAGNPIPPRAVSLSAWDSRRLAVFDGVGETFAQPGYRGCAFVRANAEMPPGSAAKTVCDTARGWLHELFTTLAGEAGARKPVALAQQLMLLYDGAVIAAQMDGNVDAATAARGLAASLLDAANTRTPGNQALLK